MASVTSGGLQLSVPQTQAIRPLTAGMITEGSSVLQSPGSMQRIKGYDVEPVGLKRHGSWVNLSEFTFDPLFKDRQDDVTRRSSEKFEDMFQLAATDGSSINIVLSNRLIYKFTKTEGFVPLPWDFDFSPTHSARSGGTTSWLFTFDGADLTDPTVGNYLAVGDWVQGFDTVTGVALYALIATIVFNAGGSGNTIVTATVPVGTDIGGTLTVFKPFKTATEDIVDWATGRGSAYVVDGASDYPFVTDGVNVNPLIVNTEAAGAGSRQMLSAKTIASYNERLYFGNTHEGSDYCRQRIRWTEVLDWSQSVAASYQDLVSTPGPVTRLKGSSEVLMAFTTDAEYYGRDISSETIPLGFFQLQSGGVSAIGPRAMAAMLNGLIFVGSDDVYMFQNPKDSGPALNRIGTPVFDAIKASIQDARKTVVLTDVKNSRILIGTPGASTGTIWSWNYKTKGWSFADQVKFTNLMASIVSEQLTYAEALTTISPTTGKAWAYGDAESAVSYGSLLYLESVTDLIVLDTDGNLIKYDADAAVDFNGAGVVTEIITQDYDFDLPDQNKSFLGLSLRIKRGAETSPTGIIAMVVYVSTDRGTTWKNLGSMTIKSDRDEARIDFRAVGPTARFRLVQSSELSTIVPWTILELTLRVRVRGVEFLRQ